MEKLAPAKPGTLTIRTREELSSLQAQLGTTLRKMHDIRCAADEEIAKRARERDECLASLRKESELIADAIVSYSKKNWSALTRDERRRAFTHPGGSIRWYQTPFRVHLTKATDTIISELRRRRLSGFVRIKEEINKQQLLQERTRIEIGRRSRCPVHPAEHGGAHTHKRIPLHAPRNRCRAVGNRTNQTLVTLFTAAFRAAVFLRCESGTLIHMKTRLIIAIGLLVFLSSSLISFSEICCMFSATRYFGWPFPYLTLSQEVATRVEAELIHTESVRSLMATGWQWRFAPHMTRSALSSPFVSVALDILVSFGLTAFFVYVFGKRTLSTRPTL
jgi:phage host-nuclease inhibitor protein Gam